MDPYHFPDEDEIASSLAHPLAQSLSPTNQDRGGKDETSWAGSGRDARHLTARVGL